MLLLRCCAALGLLVFGLFLADQRWLLFDLATLAFILGPILAAFASVHFKKEGFSRLSFEKLAAWSVRVAIADEANRISTLGHKGSR